jgi:tetratricopeptide (TPR) repeat protein
MPVTVYMGRHARRDHSLSLPDPVLAAELGLPDTCASCHADRPTVAAATAWYGEIAHRERARAVAGARKGDPSALPGVRGLIAGGQPRWRATGAALLEAFADRPGVVDQLVALAGDPDPLVRFAALGALGPAARDPRVIAAADQALAQGPEAVRVAAARLLQPPPGDARGADWRRYLAHNADQPIARIEDGTADLARGDVRGLADLAVAAKWDPSSGGTQRAYAVGLATAGRDREAWDVLVQATRVAPEDVEAWFSRGLQAVRIGDTADAFASLERATALDPGYARAWLNLGLLHAQAGHLAQAEAALDAGEKADPSSPDAGYAHAAVLRDAGRLDEARRRAERLTEQYPDHQPSRALRDSLPPGSR